MSLSDSRQRAAATKRERTRTQILDAARKLFDEHGWVATHEQLVVTSGVASATIYNHFPTKRELVIAVYAPDVLAVMQSAKPVVARNAVEQVAADFIYKLANVLTTHPTMAIALLPPLCGSRGQRETDESVLVVNLGQLVEQLARLLPTPRGFYRPASSKADDAEYFLLGMLTWITQHPQCSSEQAASLVVSRLL